MKGIIALFSLRGLSAYEILIQAIGYLGLAFNVISFQCKKHRNVMIYKTSNELFFGTQYILLGAYVGAVMNFVSTCRNAVFTVCVEKKKPTLWFQVGFGIFFIVSGILSWQGPLSLLIIFAKLITTVAYGIKNTRVLRFLTLPSSLSWLYYNYVSHTAAGVLCEVFTLVSLTIAITRFDILPIFFGKQKTEQSSAESEAQEEEIPNEKL